MMSKYTRTPTTPRHRQRNGSVDKDTLQVYCRLRPTAAEKCLKVISLKIVSAVAPDTAANQRHQHRESQYVFRAVFPDDTHQSTVFETTAEPLVANLVKGRNGLLFTYGVTGSGKTYTMTGNHGSAGIMPRCISLLFKVIDRYQATKFIFKPDKMNGFEMQSEADAQAERLVVERRKRVTLKTGSSESSVASVSDCAITQVPEPDNLYAVFVTYVEIYNNCVYDLLEDSPGKSFQNKMIREDYMHNMFVHGVSEIEVTSVAEAMQLFYRGQKRKRMAYTDLNTESSRSHSNFTIRLVQAPLKLIKENVHDRNDIVVSQLSLVDLAGSERVSRTKNTGVRLKEASKINNSLLNLRICLEILRENQASGTNRLVPYRDSKLTHLFKNFFEGEGLVRMIVCVNPSVQDYEESIQVLKFAELSQRVRIACPPPTPIRLGNELALVRRRQKRNHDIGDHNEPFPPDIAARINYNLNYSLGVFPLACLMESEHTDDYLVQRTYLETRVAQRQVLINDLKFRVQNFRQNLQFIESAKNVNDFELTKTKALLGASETEVSTWQQRCYELEQEKNQLKNVVASKNEKIYAMQIDLNEKALQVTQTLVEKEKQKQKYDSKLITQAERMNQELGVTIRERRNLQSQIRQKENKIRQVRRIFENEITPDESDREPPAKPRRWVSTRRPLLSNLITEIPPEPPTTTPATPMPIARRRSRSVGTEKWLEHRVGMATELDTILQPKIKRAKTLAKLFDHKDVINPKVSKYCLVSQEADTDGEIETRFIKGDVVPTTSGGAQVIFNDVELMKQESPVNAKSIRKRSMPVYCEEIATRCSVSLEGNKRHKT